MTNHKIASFLLLFAVFLLPLFFLPITANVLDFNKQSLLVLLTGITFIIFLAEMIKQGGISGFKRSKLYLPVSIFIGSIVVATIFSVSRFNSLLGSNAGLGSSLLTYLFLGLFFFLAAHYLKNPFKVLSVLTISLFVTFLFTVLQILGAYLLVGTRFAVHAFNTAGSLNSVGILAAISLPLFLMEFSDDGGWRRYLNNSIRLLGFLSGLFTILFINWWVIWLAVFVSMVASVMFSGRSRSYRSIALLAPLLVVALGIFAILVNFNISSLKSNLPLEVAVSQKTSAQMAAQSLRSRPLGFGPENFHVAFDKFKPVSISNSIFSQVRFNDSSSEFFNLVIEGGALSLLAFLFLLFVLFREIKKRLLFDYGRNHLDGNLLAMIVAASLSLFLYPANVTILFLFFVFLSLLVSSSQGERVNISFNSDSSYSLIAAPIFIVGTVLTLASFYLAGNDYIANIYTAKALASNDIPGSINTMVKSINHRPSDPESYRLLSQALINRLALNIQKGQTKDQTKEDYNNLLQSDVTAAVNSATQATTLDPADSQNWANRGSVYENLVTLVSGSDQIAISMYNEALSRSPNDPSLYFRIGSTNLTMANALKAAIDNPPAGADIKSLTERQNDSLSKAEEAFNKAVALNNNFGQAIYSLGVVYERQGKIPQTIKQLETILASNPQNPSIIFQLGLLYYRENMKDKAFDAWQRAVVLFPNYSNARWYLSLTYEERGDIENAINQVEEIQKLNPANQQVKDRLAQLQSGKKQVPPKKVLDQPPLNK